jgi:hypothetical protein
MQPATAFGKIIQGNNNEIESFCHWEDMLKIKKYMKVFDWNAF